MKIDNKKVIKQRSISWLFLVEEGYISTFNKEDMKILQKTHLDNLKNYISNFGIFLEAYYKTINIFQKMNLYRVINKKRIYEICNASKNKIEKNFVSINEIFDLCNKLNLKKDFLGYFLNKTQFSMSVYKSHPIRAVVKKKLFEKDYNKAFRDKMAQFVYSILVEYIILHNLIWVSCFKLSDVKSLDKWLEEI
jgi:hypothetical protein